mgnify:CR=1 FL=1
MSENEQAFIQIREISKHFGDVIAVNKVDLDIKKGELFSILGASGSGKTTLLRICLLYTSPSPRDGLLSRMPSSA